jgi:hypothetical protein
MYGASQTSLHSDSKVLRRWWRPINWHAWRNKLDYKTGFYDVKKIHQKQRLNFTEGKLSKAFLTYSESRRKQHQEEMVRHFIQE